jgi:hypothetical protein
MRNNRIFALCYRLASFVLCLMGILVTMGVFDGRVGWTFLLYYTLESNLMVLAMFGALIVKTAADLKNGGVTGEVSYYERLSAIVTLSITVTLVIFWVLLAPSMGGRGLLAFSNLQVHAITPLLMIFDFLFFAAPGKLKKSDPLIFAVIPLAYFAQSTVLGFSGVRYGAQSGSPTRFPYFFVDFDILGARVFAYVLFFIVFFMGLAYLLLWLDGKRASLRAAAKREKQF